MPRFSPLVAILSFLFLSPAFADTPAGPAVQPADKPALPPVSSSIKYDPKCDKIFAWDTFKSTMGIGDRLVTVSSPTYFESWQKKKASKRRVLIRKNFLLRKAAPAEITVVLVKRIVPLTGYRDTPETAIDKPDSVAIETVEHEYIVYKHPQNRNFYVVNQLDPQKVLNDPTY